MKCNRCGAGIAKGEEQDFHGQLLCEDCYMDVLSPARACDPWAVHSAKSFGKDGTAPQLSETQTKILQLLKETGGAVPEVICERLQIKPTDFERDVAALRHMEKLRAELRDGKKVLVLW